MQQALTSEETEIHVGKAGTCLRFLSAFFATQPGTHILDGTEQLRHRPIGLLVDALRHLGADIEYLQEEGFAPIRIKGKPLAGGTLEMPGTVSSQFISALLLIAPTLPHGLHLKLAQTPVSKPYINLTIAMMTAYGADVRWLESGRELLVKPGHYRPIDYKTEGDWTAASYWYELLALMEDNSSKIEMDGLLLNSPQGDDMAKYIFRTFDIKTQSSKNGVLISPPLYTPPHKERPDFDFDFTQYPDLAPTVVCTCLGCGRHFWFTGLDTLRQKECDRIEALVSEARKLGFVLEATAENHLIWKGERCEPSEEPISPHDDHRIAMAFAPLATKFPKMRIKDVEVVVKSYPAFWDDLRKAGFQINTIE